MLDVAVQYRSAIDDLTANRKFALRDYEMSTDDWNIAAQLCKVLRVSVVYAIPCGHARHSKSRQVFKDATMTFSKSESNIARVLPAMQKIHDVLDTNTANSKYHPAIKSALCAGTNKLAHYKAVLNHSVVYKFATSKSTSLSP